MEGGCLDGDENCAPAGRSEPLGDGLVPPRGGAVAAGARAARGAGGGTDPTSVGCAAHSHGHAPPPHVPDGDAGAAETASAVLLHHPAPDSFTNLHAAACAVLCGGHQELAHSLSARGERANPGSATAQHIARRAPPRWLRAPPSAPYPLPARPGAAHPKPTDVAAPCRCLMPLPSPHGPLRIRRCLSGLC